MADRSLAFVRLATEEDEDDGIDIRMSMWRDSEKGDVWLAPDAVLRFGLTGVMREALNARTHDDPGVVVVNRPEHDAERVATPEVIAAVNARTSAGKTEGMPAPQQVEAMTQLSGQTDTWRWQRIQDETGDLWAIDNKPALDAWAEGDKLRPCPGFQYLCIPVDVLALITHG